jgi:anti-sigma regulatory factor (Ser/Thr protein kinase)
MEKRLLIARWLGPETQPIPIYDEASVSSARQKVREAGHSLNLNPELIETVALIASELGHNQRLHSKQGYVAVRPVERLGVKGLELIAADIGSGIKQPAQAIKGRAPTSESLGAGLGAVCRLADEVEFDNRIAEGLCVVARKFEARPRAPYCEIAIMGKPYPGEIISGDDGGFVQSESQLLAAVADGLGHGPEAREASNRAIDAALSRRDRSPDEIITTLNQELADTRGCAMSVVRFKKQDRSIECVSAGDVHAHLYTRKEAQFFASTPFVVGDRKIPQRKVRIEEGIAEPGSVLVVFTDGLKSRTSLKGQLEVLRRPPIEIAQYLLENDSRPDDDALVLVARFLT